MSQLFNSLKSLIDKDQLTMASQIVEEKESNVSNASSSIIASFLGVLLKLGDTPQIRNILHEAGNLDILSCVDDICSEKASKNQLKIGDDFTQHLLGDKAADFTAPIAQKHGISKVATNRLVSMIAPIIAGFLGNKLVSDGWSFHKLFNELEKEKDSFKSDIPNALIQSFNLNSTLQGKNTYEAKTEEKKKGNSWLPWLAIIVLLLLVFLLWRSCRSQNEPVVAERTTTREVVQTPVESAQSTTRVEERNATELALPNGVTLHTVKGSTEEEMLDFLKSDDYKDATAEELKDHLFEFDNVSFKFDSATELNEGSQTQINNIAEILKHYRDAKVDIIGFADKRGTEGANMEISKERAQTIERLLKQAGVNQIVKVEGLGESHAKNSADAPDSARKKDRDIALRFVK